MKRPSMLLTILAVQLLSALWFSARSTELVSSFGGDRPVTLEDYLPRMEDVEGYSEEWSHNVYLEDGAFIAVDFGVTNLALTSDHDGFLRARYKDPQGQDTRCKAELDDDEWKYSKSGFSLDFRKGKVKGDLKGLDITVRCGKLAMDLHFENRIPPYKPGGGVLRFGDDGIYRVVFTAPRAHVTGTITVKGETRQIAGVGHGMHTHYNLRPDKQVRRWFRFKQIDKDISIILAEMEATRDYGLARNGWAMVLDSKGSLIATAKVRYEFDGFIKDQKSKEGYQIPRRVRLAAVDGENQMAGVMLMENIKSVSDPTADMGAVKRAIIRRYTKPKDYHVNCTYKLTLRTKDGDRRFEGKGVYRFFYVNP